MNGDTDSSASIARILKGALSDYQSFVKGFLEILDNIERLADQEGTERYKPLPRQGRRLLMMHGVRPTAVVGEPIDLKYHQVVETEYDGEISADQVTRIHRQGYELLVPDLGSVILRYAEVVVSTRDLSGEGRQQAAAVGNRSEGKAAGGSDRGLMLAATENTDGK